eukprot:402890-Pelagomonas_calceolata.AAC.1
MPNRTFPGFLKPQLSSTVKLMPHKLARLGKHGLFMDPVDSRVTRARAVVVEHRLSLSPPGLASMG